MSKGFTLVELLVAVLIMGILSAVAVSSYQDYTLRAQRADARSVLLQLAASLERNYSAAGRYDQDTNGQAILVPASLAQSPQTGSARYNISFADQQATTFTIQAVPVTADPLCGTFFLNQQGVQSVSGTGTQCWQH